MNRRTFMRRVALAGTATASMLRRHTVAAPPSSTPSVVRPIAFAHFAVRAHDLAASVSWYETLLGSRPLHVAPFGAWSSWDREHHRISVFARPGSVPTPGGLAGWDRFSVSYDSLTELAANYRLLEKSGISPIQTARHGDSLALIYADPSANRVELLLDRFDRVADLESYLGAASSGRSSPSFDPETTLPRIEEERLPESVLRPSELLHTVIRTQNLETMARWYCTVLGCSVIERSDRTAILSWDHRYLRILLVEDETIEPAQDGTGFDHFAFEYRSMSDLVVSTFARLNEMGIRPYWCTNHGMTTSIYYADPDGNRVETQVDNFTTKAECMRYITGEDFARNPVGVDFDPQEMVAKVKGGASYEELHRRVEGPRTTPVPQPEKGRHY